MSIFSNIKLLANKRKQFIFKGRRLRAVYYSYYFDQNVCCLSLKGKEIILKWIPILAGEKSHYNYLLLSSTPSCPKDKEIKIISKALKQAHDPDDTVRQEYCKFSEHQPLPDSIWIISFKQFTLRITLHRFKKTFSGNMYS